MVPRTGLSRLVRHSKIPARWPRAGIVAVLTLVSVPAAAASQTCEPGTISLAVDGQTLRLNKADVTRIPYGRDMTAWIAPREGIEALEVVARYHVSSRERGVRTDMIVAERPDAVKNCWAAALERLHLNESGDLIAALYVRPRYLGGASERTLVAAFLARLDAIPSGVSRDVYVEMAREAAASAAAVTFAEPTSVQVIEGEARVGTPVAARLATLPANNLEVSAALNRARSNARLVVERAEYLDTVATSAGLATPCAAGADLAGMAAAAGELADATLAALRERVVDGRLPWPECALGVLDRVGAPTPRDESRLEDLRGLVESLVRAPELHTLVGVATAAREVIEMAAAIETMTVPFGADILERYTQADLVSAFLPEPGMTQAFAAATWYIFTPGASNDFSARVTPGSGLFNPDRWGIQVGYPVGAPATESSDSVPFEPSVLVGGIGRINGVLSLSGGVVVGREGGERKSPVYLSFNFDLSNLGPLQKVFARRDPD